MQPFDPAQEWRKPLEELEASIARLKESAQGLPPEERAEVERKIVEFETACSLYLEAMEGLLRERGELQQDIERLEEGRDGG
jgi:chromosome segregation ATPase